MRYTKINHSCIKPVVILELLVVHIDKRDENHSARKNQVLLKQNSSKNNRRSFFWVDEFMMKKFWKES